MNSKALVIKEIDRLLEQAKSLYDHIIMKAVKNKQKNIMKTINKDCKNKHEINIGNYLMKRKT